MNSLTINFCLNKEASVFLKNIYLAISFLEPDSILIFYYKQAFKKDLKNQNYKIVLTWRKFWLLSKRQTKRKNIW